MHLALVRLVAPETAAGMMPMATAQESCPLPKRGIAAVSTYQQALFRPGGKERGAFPAFATSRA